MMHIALRSRTFYWMMFLAAALGVAPCSWAEVRLPKVFASHMVLQREMPIVIWGWAQPNETVTVTLGESTVQARADGQGEWKATLPARPAGGPFRLIVAGSSTVALDDVLIGEVWICSGQSNMELGIGNAKDGQQEIAAANHPEIRLLLVKHDWSPLPVNDIEGQWKVCSPATVAEDGWGGFSAAAYYFGRELQRKLGVPVGLIESCWGGTRIESWTPPQGFAAVPALRHDYELVELGDPATRAHEERLRQALDQTSQWLVAARQALADHTMVPPMPAYPSELLPPHDLQNATALFNGMIHPLIPLAMRGVIWYQGEANLGDGRVYTERMKALIDGWRALWGEGDFPFYYVQIAPFNYGGDPAAEALLWEAQAAAQSIPNTGMAVVNDIGNLADIHPKDKQDVGHRLALLALAKTYHESGLVFSGPTFASMDVEGNKLRIHFDNVDGGLVTRDTNAPDWFELIDASRGGFVKANARIEGSTVVLSAPGVEHPGAMRFAWSMLAEPNLMNRAGLPAGAFRAGKTPMADALREVPESKDYKLVYDFDLGRLGPEPPCDADNHQKIPEPFDRIAYCLELRPVDGAPEYIYVSMDAFTSDLGKIGVPTAPSGAFFQQNVSNMDVFSNARGIVTGTGLTGGNIEFWPNNYAPNNAAHVPNASSATYDFGDESTDPADGYGSMQVHNHEARQTVFAVNHWREGSRADVGIGNQPAGNPDWTFSANAGSYIAKRLRVLVRLKR